MTWRLKDNFHKLSPQSRLYNFPKPLIGLTGGIASGKSTVAQYLKKRHAPIICADQLVKNIYQKPQTLSLVESLAPSCIKEENIDFAKLRRLFFNDKKLKEKIECHLYQHLESEFYKAHKELINPQIIIYDVPLLFEKRIQSKFDLVLLIYCTSKTQQERLNLRDTMDLKTQSAILSEQLSLEEKKSLTPHVFVNEQHKDSFSQWSELDSFIERYFRR